MSRRGAAGAHFVQQHAQSALGGLHRGFGSGQAAPDHVDELRAHCEIAVGAVVAIRYPGAMRRITARDGLALRTF